MKPGTSLLVEGFKNKKTSYRR